MLEISLFLTEPYWECGFGLHRRHQHAKGVWIGASARGSEQRELGSRISGGAAVLR
jgi:hypothetical protein